MRVIKWVLGIVLGLVVLMGGIGLLLSPKFSVSRSIVVNTAPDRVYALVEDPRRWKEWTVWNQRDPAMSITYSGQERGVDKGAGAGWAWKSKTEGDGKMTFTSAEPGRRLSYDLFFPDFGTTSQGELRFAAAGLGTKVTWVMNGNIGDNPFYRWMGLFADGMVGKDFDAGLANLKALAEKP